MEKNEKLIRECGLRQKLKEIKNVTKEVLGSERTTEAKRKELSINKSNSLMADYSRKFGFQKSGGTKNLIKKKSDLGVSGNENIKNGFPVILSHLNKLKDILRECKGEEETMPYELKKCGVFYGCKKLNGEKTMCDKNRLIFGVSKTMGRNGLVEVDSSKGELNLRKTHNLGVYKSEVRMQNNTINGNKNNLYISDDMFSKLQTRFSEIRRKIKGNEFTKVINLMHEK